MSEKNGNPPVGKTHTGRRHVSARQRFEDNGFFQVPMTQDIVDRIHRVPADATRREKLQAYEALFGHGLLTEQQVIALVAAGFDEFDQDV